MKLSDDRAKDLLRGQGLPVPEGAVAQDAAEAARIAGRFAGSVVISALTVAGNTGGAGAPIRVPATEAGPATARLLATSGGSGPVSGVYIERAIDSALHLTCRFGFDDRAPRVTVGAGVSTAFDPRTGLRPWEAIELWSQSGLSGRPLAEVGRLTARLWQAIVALDAQSLDVHGLLLDSAHRPWLAGVTLDIDDAAVGRQPGLADLPGLEPVNPRERAVALANRSHPGGDARYVELEGDIGLLVAGGGAGMVQHDAIRDLGGHPANHSDISPAPGTEKMEAVLDAVFANPRVRSLLVGWNHLQMAPCDTVIAALTRSIARNRIDTTRFPVVIRLFGPREAEARAMAARLPGIVYLPRSASLADGARAVVAATRALAAPGGSA
ncbi:MAG: hypothetical protein KJZ59_11735 [Pararhodobacter sp.]|nr:hypothetical protein [Pararhodobacter sp.]